MCSASILVNSGCTVVLKDAAGCEPDCEQGPVLFLIMIMVDSLNLKKRKLQLCFFYFIFVFNNEISQPKRVET